MRRKKDRSNGITALYERLSRDDDNAGESNSIVHQKIITARQEKRYTAPEVRYFRGFSYADKIIGHHKKTRKIIGNLHVTYR